MLLPWAGQTVFRSASRVTPPVARYTLNVKLDKDLVAKGSLKDPVRTLLSLGPGLPNGFPLPPQPNLSRVRSPLYMA